MAELDSLENAGKLLQSAEIGEIITALGLGIAKTQAALDNNSIAQLQKMSEIEVGGKSLLELGFVPAFYAFDFADLSASVSFKLRKQEIVDTRITGKIEFGKKYGYSEDDYYFMQEQENNSEYKNYKGTRSFTGTTSTSEAIRILNKSVSMNQSTGVITRIEDFMNEIREIEGVSRVDLAVKKSEMTSETSSRAIVKYLDGYISMYVPEEENADKVVFGVEDYPNTPLGIISSPTIEIKDGFNTTIAGIDSQYLLNGSEYICLKADKYYFNETAGKSIEVYFKYNSSFFDPNYSESSPSDSNTDYENDGMDFVLDTIALILRNDNEAKIHIVGHTDSTGNQGTAESGNIKLGMDRAKAIQAYLIRKGAQENQVTVESQGENLDNSIAPQLPQKDIRFRKASLTFINGRDYFCLMAIGIGNISNISMPQADEYNILFPSGVPNNAPLEVAFSQFGTAAEVALNETTQEATFSQGVDKYSAEILHGMTYLVHNEATLCFTALSQTEEEILIESKSTRNEAYDGVEDVFIVSDSKNAKERIITSSENVNKSTTIAVGASIDYRTAREFELSMEGNASISARIKTVPPPDEFKDYIQEAFVSNSGQ